MTSLWLSSSQDQSRAMQRSSVKGVFFIKFGLCSLMRRKHQGLARTPDRHGFPKRCRFGAGPSVMTKFFEHHRLPRKSVTTRLFMCVHVCVYLRVCALSENGCFVLFLMLVFFGVIGVVWVWFQQKTKSCVFSQPVQNKRAGTTR